MRIDIVNNAEGFSEDKLNGLDEYIVKLSEAVLSGDYSSPQVTRSLKDAYATLTFVTPEEIKEINKEQRNIDKETDCLSFPMLADDPGPERGYPADGYPDAVYGRDEAVRRGAADDAVGGTDHFVRL